MTEGTSTGPSHAEPTHKRRARIRQSVSGLILIVVLSLATNFFLVGNPVKSALAKDSRNERFNLVAHYRYYIDPSTLVLDVRSLNEAAPVDLLRGLFQSAEALHDEGRTFSKVILSRSRSAVFYLSGEDFYRMGEDYGRGENVAYLMRTLPEKLYDPDGTHPYSTWTGGLLGVAIQQMKDVGDAGMRWGRGK